jgi:hypothetical protein
MTLSLSVPPEVEARLRERADAVGEAVEVYASKVLTEAVAVPTIDEILAPVRAEFAKTGMSEQEILDLGRRELDALRAEKKAASA